MQTLESPGELMLTFALDFDDTFTACPDLWRAFVRQAEAAGHRVFLVTARRDTDENRAIISEALGDCVLPKVFAALGSKLDAVEKRGIKVDIWIDDDPERLVHGH